MNKYKITMSSGNIVEMEAEETIKDVLEFLQKNKEAGFKCGNTIVIGRIDFIELLDE